MFISRVVLAWIVELTSITVALVVASCAMLALVYFGRIGSNQRQ
jgi:hypothetical protein